MKTIHATSGWLTQVSIPEEDRLFFHSITTASPSAWMEVTNEYKEAWDEAHPAPPEEPEEELL